MPYYDYRCPDCGATVTDKRDRADRNLPHTCPCCGGEMRREFCLVGVIYRGSGWGSERADGEAN